MVAVTQIKQSTGGFNERMPGSNNAGKKEGKKSTDVRQDKMRVVVVN